MSSQFTQNKRNKKNSKMQSYEGIVTTALKQGIPKCTTS